MRGANGAGPRRRKHGGESRERRADHKSPSIVEGSQNQNGPVWVSRRRKQHSLGISLASIAGRPRWVAWRQGTGIQGKAPKIPIDPSTGKNAATDKGETWDTRDAAERAWSRIQHSDPHARGAWCSASSAMYPC